MATPCPECGQPRPPATFRCVVCGKPVTVERTRGRRTKTCSAECYAKRRKARRREWGLGA
mgnify:CR=1 FL=1